MRNNKGNKLPSIVCKATHLAADATKCTIYLHVQQGSRQSGRPQWYTGYATGAAAAAGAVATAATNCRHPQLPSRTTFSLHPPAAAVAPLPSSCSSLANLAFFLLCWIVAFVSTPAARPHSNSNNNNCNLCLLFYFVKQFISHSLCCRSTYLTRSDVDA